MTSPYELAGWLGIWIGAIAVLLLVRRLRRVEGAGLVYSYLLGLWTLHWLGAAVYLAPWYEFRDPATVLDGLVVSAYAVLAFVVGSVALAPVILATRASSATRRSFDAPWRDLPMRYVAVGAAFYTLTFTIIGRLPTLGMVIVAGQQFIVIGLCLGCRRSWREGHVRRTLAILAVATVMPLVTIIGQGFMGYGAAAASVVFVFATSFLRPRWKVATAYVVVGYVALSFYVGYMRDRSEIREVVWGGRSYVERLDQLGETLGNFEWFDPREPKHLVHVDLRLNQNFLVGTAASRLAVMGDYAYGATLLDSALALVPRVIWPSKPVAGGSGDLVARYTGIRFAEGTSVGVGHVLEAYVNFGSLGVLLVFAMLGTLVTVLDAAARERLEANDWEGFAFRYAPGLALLQVGGSIAEAIGTAGATLVAVMVVNHFMARWAPQGHRSDMGHLEVAAR